VTPAATPHASVAQVSTRSEAWADAWIEAARTPARVPTASPAPAAIASPASPDAEPRLAASTGDALTDRAALAAPERAMTVAAPQRPARPAAVALPAAIHAPPPRTSQDLLVEHLDVRIITEPVPRAPVPTAPLARTPSTRGAWRPSARRFLGRP